MNTEQQGQQQEAPKPPTIWAVWMAFKKNGFPSLGTFGKTERKVVIISDGDVERALRGDPRVADQAIQCRELRVSTEKHGGPAIEYTPAEYERAEEIVREHHRRKSAIDFAAYRQKYEGKYFKCNANPYGARVGDQWVYVAIEKVTETERSGFSFGVTAQGEVWISPDPYASPAHRNLGYTGDLIEITESEFWAEADRTLAVVRNQLTKRSE